MYPAPMLCHSGAPHWPPATGQHSRVKNNTQTQQKGTAKKKKTLNPTTVTIQANKSPSFPTAPSIPTSQRISVMRHRTGVIQRRKPLHPHSPCSNTLATGCPSHPRVKQPTHSPFSFPLQILTTNTHQSRARKPPVRPTAFYEYPVLFLPDLRFPASIHKDPERGGGIRLYGMYVTCRNM